MNMYIEESLVKSNFKKAIKANVIWKIKKCKNCNREFKTIRDKAELCFGCFKQIGK